LELYAPDIEKSEKIEIGNENWPQLDI